jgi:hypothetical protein
MIERNCHQCFKLFMAKDARTKYCGAKCRHKFWTLKTDKEVRNARVRKYRAKRYKEDGCWRDEGPKSKAQKAWMIEIKSNPCVDCGGKFEVCCMDFDHRIGTTKAYNVGSMFAHHYSRELIETELAKCDLVCSNCHRIRTRDRRTGSGKHRRSSEI